MRIAKELAWFCGSMLLWMSMLGLYHAALAENLVAKYIVVRQLPLNLKSDTKETLGPRAQYLLRCRGKGCAGRVPLQFNNTTYYYDLMATISTDSPDYTRINLDLRPIETGCNPRCAEPTFTSMIASLAWTRQGHVTVPIHQSGQLGPDDPPNSTTNMIYQVSQDPVAYLDVSIQFE
jgi:hypothetical protein